MRVNCGGGTWQGGDGNPDYKDFLLAGVHRNAGGNLVSAVLRSDYNDIRSGFSNFARFLLVAEFAHG